LAIGRTTWKIVPYLGIDPGTGVLHCYEDVRWIMNSRLYDQQFFTTCDGIHCLDSVHCQIHEDLLQSGPAREHVGNIPKQFGLNRYPFLLNFAFDQSENVHKVFVNVNPILLAGSICILGTRVCQFTK